MNPKMKSMSGIVQSDATRAGAAGDAEAPNRDGSRAELLAALPHRSRRREVWTGVFVLAGIFAALFALFTLTDAATFRGRYIVTTVVGDAGGIRRGDPVQMRGVNIGRVQRFEMAPGGVAVRLELEGEYTVPRDSRVALKSQGLLGGMVAEVVPGHSNDRLRGGDVLPGVHTDGMLDVAGGMSAQASTILNRIDRVLSDQTADAIGDGVGELKGLLTELNHFAAEQRKEIASITRSLSRSASGVEKTATGPEVARLVARLDSLTEQAELTSRSLGRASANLEVVLGRLERGEGTLGRLSQDEALYQNMNQAAASLDSLLQDVRKNPKKYINFTVF
jgi:phospholipid/cholesterol/gamma-HCH transport system substrate-binding protein